MTQAVITAQRSPLQRLVAKIRRTVASRRGSAAYWSVYGVADDIFKSREQSLRHFRWRTDQYVDYINLMPVSGRDGQVVLDYGCGPGNDLVGFVENSTPKRLIGADVSPRSLDIAMRRLALHEGEVEFIRVSEDSTRLPLESDSVDVVHSSGVLHHVPELGPTLAELHRVLRPGGELRVMVYNYDSISLHLNSGYLERRKLREFGSNVPVLSIFQTTTDGRECPISRCYRPGDFIGIVMDAGFSRGSFLGAAISMREMDILQHRFKAIADPRLDPEHRDFLVGLTFDNRCVPFHGNVVAGQDACYSFIK